MKTSIGLVSSLDRCWARLSSEWKTSRHDPSEKAIHDLRVSARRMLAVLGLLRVLSNKKAIIRLRRSVKEILKAVGPLRDVQVEIQRVSRLRPSRTIRRFERTLERRERRRIDSVEDLLRQGKQRDMTRDMKIARRAASCLQQKHDKDAIVESVNEGLHTRWNEVSWARRRCKWSDEETLHRVRIALKKLRYAIEAAQPVVGGTTRREMRQIETLQQVLGDRRDIQLLIRSIETWAGKRGKEDEIAPAVAVLRKQRTKLDAKVRPLIGSFGNPSPYQRQPAAEATIAVPNPKASSESSDTAGTAQRTALAAKNSEPGG